MDLKKVTVITIIKNAVSANRAHFFDKCIESVAIQTYSNIEHLIIDGASNDGTLDLIKEYADKYDRVKYVSESDNGIYDAMNKGLALATGDYIAIMNSDDFYSKNNAVEMLVNKLEKEKSSWIYGVAELQKENENTPYMIRKTRMKKPFLYMPVCHQAMLVKKEMFDKYGYFDTDFKIAGDYHFLLRMVLGGERYSFLEEKICIFTEGGLSHNNPNCGFEDALALEKLLPEITNEVAKGIKTNNFVPLNIMNKLIHNQSLWQRIYLSFFNITSYFESKYKKQRAKKTN